MAFLNQRFFRCTLVLGMIPIKMSIKFTFGSERRVTMRTYRVLQVGSKMMSSSAMLNEPIVALEGGAAVTNSTFVFLLQFPGLTLPQFQQTHLLARLIFDAGAGGSSRAPGPQGVGGGQMFPQFLLI